MEHKKLYEMKLHDEIELWRGLDVVRVPGGWLYRFDNEQVGGHWTTSSCFVPFDNEFQANPQPED